MRKNIKIIALLCAVVIGISGCGNTQKEMLQSTNETEITLYLGNDDADGFVTKTVGIESLSPENIMNALAENKVISEDVSVLSFKDEEETLTLDLSKEYEEYVSSYGTAGELIAVGGVVNTFLDAYDADTITILVEGQTWGTGHMDYSEPLGKYPME